MQAMAVVLKEPEHLVLSSLDLSPPGPDDAVVDVEWSGVSTGTERLLWSGRMPPFPGMGYPLVPGYESVGRVTQARRVLRAPARSARLRSRRALLRRGARPVWRCSLSRGRAVATACPDRPSSSASAASCWRSPRLPITRSAAPGALKPERIVGHGVLGRLLARLTIATGGEPPIVWERNRKRAERRGRLPGARPGRRSRRDCRVIYDVSGDSTLLDALIARLAPGGRDRARGLL